MRIERLHIDRFGLFADQECAGLSSGLCLFLGRNEAGKSTCRHFLQSMLFGYKRGNRTFSSLSGKRGGGGSLFLQSAAHGSLVLNRQPGANEGKAILVGPDKAPLGEERLLHLLGGLTVDVFENIFAVSLEKLMALSSLRGDKVRHALHGAVFGLGLQSPAQVLNRLEEHMSTLLKRDSAGVSALLNNCLRELNEVREEHFGRTPDLQIYAEIQTSLEDMGQRLELLDCERVEQEQSLRLARRRRELWPQWQEVLALRRELSELRAGDFALAGKGNTPLFAPDAIQRLDALLARQEERQISLVEAQNNHSRLKRELEALQCFDLPLSLPPAVAALHEQIGRRRNDAEALPAQILEYERLVELQKNRLSRIGSGWNRERIAGVDLSLAARERAEQLRKGIAGAGATLEQSKQESARLAEEFADATQEEENSLRALSQYADPPVPLPHRAAAESVRAAFARAEASLTDLPRLEERASRAHAQAARALADIDPSWSADTLAAFDLSLSARQRMSDCSSALLTAENALRDAGHSLVSATETRRDAERKVSAAKDILARYNTLPDFVELEKRHGRLRWIERLRMEMVSAEQAAIVAKTTLANFQAAQAGWAYLIANPLEALAQEVFFWGGMAMYLVGFALGLYGMWSGQENFSFPGVLFAFLGLFSAVLHGWTPTFFPWKAKRNEAALCKALGLALKRYQTIEASLVALCGDAVAWLSLTRSGAPDDEDIARSFRILDEQGRQLTLKNRDGQEYYAACQALEAAQEKLEQSRQALNSATQHTDAARGAWGEYLHALSLPRVMRPEAALSVFDRVETALARISALNEADRAAANAWNVIDLCFTKALALPFLARWAEPGLPCLADILAAPPLSMTEGNRTRSFPAAFSWGVEVSANENFAKESAVHSLSRALAALAKYEETVQEKSQLERVRQERVEKRERLQARLDLATRAVKEASTVLYSERCAFDAWRMGYGFAKETSPDSAVEALVLMQEFLDCEKECQIRAVALKTTCRGIAAFLVDVASLAAEAGLPVPVDLGVFANRTERARDDSCIPLLPVALHLLHSLAAHVEEASRIIALRREKEREFTTYSETVSKAEAALAVTRKALDVLLAGAGAAEEEAFRADFARAARCREIESRERAVLASLATLLPDVEDEDTLEKTLSLLMSESLEDLDSTKAALEVSLAELDGEKSFLSEKRGQLRERQTALSGGGRDILHLREASLQEELHNLSRQWSVLALAREFLLMAKERFEREGAQGVMHHASDLFAAITQGEYSGMAASLDGEKFTAIHRSGVRLDAEKNLSQGTREQLYLALRLAYVKNHAAKAEPLPMILDDILVNFDPGRAARTAAVLVDFAKENQILFFTCHPFQAKILLTAAKEAERAGAPAPSAFGLERGVITPLDIDAFLKQDVPDARVTLI